MKNQPIKTQQIPETLIKLTQQKERELDMTVLEVVLDDHQNAHILAQRNRDGTYAAWTSYTTGEDSTSYIEFYSGKYDMSLSDAVDELKRRTGRDTI